ncbi:uncharacterized protein LOC114462202 [Scomber scombrus]|uniref:Uncharacterized protein LOC114462202 n=1 Tax=Scomber scombrus TaxID=13677 RepID=A0AAV1PG73_SCOSC
MARAARFSFVSISPVLFRFGGTTCLFCSCSMSSQVAAEHRNISMDQHVFDIPHSMSGTSLNVSGKARSIVRSSQCFLNNVLQQEYVGLHGFPAYQHVLNLALWEKFLEGDKGPVGYPTWYMDCLTQGRFKKVKSTHAPTDITVWLESMKSSMNTSENKSYFSLDMYNEYDSSSNCAQDPTSYTSDGSLVLTVLYHTLFGLCLLAGFYTVCDLADIPIQQDLRCFCHCGLRSECCDKDVVAKAAVKVCVDVNIDAPTDILLE